MKFSCLFGAHRRRAAAVWWDGFDFRSKCRHCGVPLYKHGNKRWRRLDPKREALFLRYQETQIEFAPDSRIANPSFGGGHCQSEGAFGQIGPNPS